MKNFFFRLLYSLIALSFIAGCGSGLEDLIELELDPPSRKEIDRSRMGVNNFFVDREFGSIRDQFLEIRDTLGIRHIRILFAWTNDVQPSPAVDPFYAFYDEIIDSIPSGIDVTIVLAHSPDWMSNPSNWTTGNPRTTWVERWLRPTVSRYAGRGGITGWQIWNEPDNLSLASDVALGLTDPANYFELLNAGSAVIRIVDPTRLVVMAATRSIQQNSGENLRYNQDLQNLGAEDIIDVWSVHYYGEQFEKVIQGGGVADFLNGISVSIWITESGEQGPNNQLAYVETVWPFLREEIPGIDRIYYYQFGETVPIDINFGLRTTDPSAPVSDLYVDLRDG